MILHVYIAPQQGWQPLGDEILMSFDVNKNILSLWSFVASFKKSLWSLILYNFFILYMYIAPGQEQTAPRGQNFDVNRNVVTSFICCKFPKNVFEVWFYTIFFHDLIHEYSSRQGQTAPREQNFDVNRKSLSLYPSVVSFKEISLKSDFKHSFFMI